MGAQISPNSYINNNFLTSMVTALVNAVKVGFGSVRDVILNLFLGKKTATAIPISNPSLILSTVSQAMPDDMVLLAPKNKKQKQVPSSQLCVDKPKGDNLKTTLKIAYDMHFREVFKGTKNQEFKKWLSTENNKVIDRVIQSYSESTISHEKCKGMLDNHLRALINKLGEEKPSKTQVRRIFTQLEIKLEEAITVARAQ